MWAASFAALLSPVSTFSLPVQGALSQWASPGGTWRAVGLLLAAAFPCLMCQGLALLSRMGIPLLRSTLGCSNGRICACKPLCIRVIPQLRCSGALETFVTLCHCELRVASSSQIPPASGAVSWCEQHLRSHRRGSGDHDLHRQTRGRVKEAELSPQSSAVMAEASA